ncbi:ABC transporter ATP-binding protein [Heliorestis acidaminivorans]|uniref:ABC transporter ATP-binding protein n=1 Tax=Heliorestis acidaminivorans TaxID=553427 RepID=A0A6I0F4E2_9FIRM|nr:ABC transporter ATP-binding protein [Heliorestis acidaminivorans]KAB2953442.1 ABC transporter ATP-binding protein [Heliorestis acidaminivorans]
MIEAISVSKSFGTLEALKKASLKVEKGSVYGIVGSNGAGKTTLLKILAGIYQQDQGEVRIDGAGVFENVNVKEKIQFIPDALYFFAQHSIEDMAQYYRRIYPTWNEKRYQGFSSIFQIDRTKKVTSLSKGMQRQVAFWLALSTMPEILILDEPLDGLDPVMRKKVKKLIIDDVADRELTVLISSHNLRELEDLCDHIGILHKGDLFLQRELDDLKREIHKVQIAFKGDLPEAIREHKSILYHEKRGSVSLFVVRGAQHDVLQHFQQFQPLILDLLPLTLDEIFIYEMGGLGYAVEELIAE